MALLAVMLFLSFASRLFASEMPIYYPSEISNSSYTGTINVCPGSENAGFGSLRLNRPESIYTVDNANATISVKLATDSTGTCGGNKTIFGYYLVFRAFHLSSTDGSQTDSPAFTVTLQDTSRGSISAPDTQQINYTSSRYATYPRAELLFTTNLYSTTPEIVINVTLNQKVWNGSVNPLIIDFFSIADSDGDKKDTNWIRCDTLGADVTKAAYCMPRSSEALACPYDCAGNVDFPDTMFDSKGYSYGSCGLKRNATLCGERMDRVWQEPWDWQQKSSTIWAISAVSGVVFILGPVAVISAVWNKHKR